MSGPSRSFAAHLAIAFCLGALLPPTPRASLVAVGGAPVLLAAAWRAPPLLAATCAAGAFALLGWTARAAATPPDVRLLEADRAAPRHQGLRDGEVWLEGAVDGAPETFADRVRFTMRERSGERLQVWAATPALPLGLGDRVRLAAKLRRPEGPRNPGGRDAAAQLAASGIRRQAFARGEPIRTAPPSPLAWVERARHRFARGTARTLAPQEAALVAAIATGQRDGIDAATNDAFARSGLAHVLSVSGLHLSVVVFGAWRLLTAALLRSDALCARADPRRVAAASCIPLAAAYALATGASVPVVRSAIATGAGFAAVALAREVRPLHAIALALAAIVSVDPGALLDPSLQLSFASVAALAAFTRPLRSALPLDAPEAGAGWRPRAREWLVQSLCASAAASAGTAPIVACHFRRLPLAGLLANVAGVPISSALTVAATAAAVASAVVPSATRALLWLCHPLAWSLLAVNRVFADLPGAAPPIASPGAACAAACCALGALAWRTRGATRGLAALGAAACLLAPGPFRAWAAASRGDVLEVVFLGVGQGDCALLRLPDGSAVLVDAGGDANAHVDAGRRDIGPFLRDAGVTRLAAVFLSHGDADHVVALPSLARDFPVDAVFTSGDAVDSAARALLVGSPTPRHVTAGEAWTRAGVRFEVLAPPARGGPADENDRSMILRVVHGTSTLLFLGDVEADGEAALVAAAPRDALRSDVVKVAHHGSRTSSTAELVAAVRPRIAVVSVGAGNRFGFPSAEVVERWSSAGAQVARTDAGAVRVVSDGRGVRVTPAGAALSGVALLRERL